METVVQRPATARGDRDRDAFSDFVAPWWNDMARLAQRLAPAGDWEDVLQDALSSAWRKRGQFDETRGTARVWLLAIVADQSFKWHRRMWGRREQALEDSPVDDAPADVDLARALNCLTRRQRTAVELHYYLGLPVADVAAALQCRPGTVKSTLSDARARLRRELGEDHRDA